MTPEDYGGGKSIFPTLVRLQQARKRLRDLIGEGSTVQQQLDDDNTGLTLIVDKNEAGEDIVYTTDNPELVEEYCDRLEAERASN